MVTRCVEGMFRRENGFVPYLRTDLVFSRIALGHVAYLNSFRPHAQNGAVLAVGLDLQAEHDERNTNDDHLRHPIPD